VGEISGLNKLRKSLGGSTKQRGESRVKKE